MKRIELSGKQAAAILLAAAVSLLLGGFLLHGLLPRTLTAADGGYEVAMTYRASARLPKGVTLDVQELTGERYEDYCRRARTELGYFGALRAFDVRCLAPDGSEVEPAAPVKVSFRPSEASALPESTRVFHFTEHASLVMPVLPGAVVNRADSYYALTFQTDSFSVYALAFSGEGGAKAGVKEGEINLSELLTEMGLRTDEGNELGAEVKGVAWGAPESGDPVAVESIKDENDENITVDWKLTVPENFSSQKLTLTRGDNDTPDLDITLAGSYHVAWVNEIWGDEEPQILQEIDASTDTPEPDYTGETPVKEQTAQYTYGAFAGWVRTIDPATGNVTYTASYDRTLRSYTVTWKNWDDAYNKWDDEQKNWDKVLSTSTVPYGETPEYTGEAPTRPNWTAESGASAKYSFTWKEDENARWTQTEPDVDPDAVAAEPTGLMPVTGDTTYYAVYDKTLLSYTVQWYDKEYTYNDARPIDGQTIELPYGEEPAFTGVNPTKAMDEQGNWTFTGWTLAPPAVDEASVPTGIQPVRGNARYYPCFTTASVELVLQGRLSHRAIPGAAFELRNSEEAVVWRGSTNADGKAYIQHVEPESALAADETGGGAAFEPGSSYTLRQTSTKQDPENLSEYYFLPTGSWTIRVSGDGKFSMRINSAPGDYSTQLESPQPSGISFKLFNELTHWVVFDYNYPSGDSPAAIKMALPSIRADCRYTIPDEVPDPTFEGYQFVGWIDFRNNVKQGQEAVFNTRSNNPEHRLRAEWRVPLSVSAKSFPSGDPESAVSVSDAVPVPVMTEEQKTYVSMDGFSASLKAFEGFEWVQGLEDAGNAVAFAELSHGDSALRITALMYDAEDHNWAYRIEGQNSGWTALEPGDSLTLYYSSSQLTVKRVKLESTDGTAAFSPLGDDFPDSSLAVGSDRWYTAADLFANDAERHEALIEGTRFFQYYGLGGANAAGPDVLLKGETDALQDFCLKRSGGGFLYTAAPSQAGSVLSGLTTIYLVYAETPPPGSALLDVANHTQYAYQITDLRSGGSDLLQTQMAVRIGEGGTLRFFDGVNGEKHTLTRDLKVETGDTAELVLLNTAGSNAKFQLDGGLPGSDSVAGDIQVSIAVKYLSDTDPNLCTATRSILKKSGTINQLLRTVDKTKGSLLPASDGHTVVSLDELTEPKSFTTQKRWENLADPSPYTAHFRLYEVGDGTNVPPLESQDAAALFSWLREQGIPVVRLGDEFTIKGKDKNTKTTDNLPGNYCYFVVETPVPNGFTAEQPVGPDWAWAQTVSNTPSAPVCRLVIPDNPEHELNGTEYTSLKLAFEAVPENTPTTVELLSNCIISAAGTASVQNNRNITLDGKGRTVYRRCGEGEDMLRVENGGALALQNVTLDGKSGNTTYKAAAGHGGLVTVGSEDTTEAGSGGSLTVGTGAKLRNGSAPNGAAILVKNGSTLNLNAGCRISGNSASSGGAIGINGTAARVHLSGNAFVYDNKSNDAQYNIWLDQDSDEILWADGLTADAKIGIRTPDKGAAYQNRGRPAKAFARYTSSGFLNKLINDGMSSETTSARYGHICDAELFTENEGKQRVVWGETFRFTVQVQWLNADFRRLEGEDIPDGASAALTVSGGENGNASTTTEQTVTLSGDWEQGYVFRGLALYDETGADCRYYVTETDINPMSCRRVCFTGDKGVLMSELPGLIDADRPLTRSDKERTVYVSNCFRHTSLTVGKEITGAAANTPISATFALYAFPNDGSAHGLPAQLRSSHFQTEGGNRWSRKTGAAAGTVFHNFYDLIQSPGQTPETWVKGDVVRVNGSFYFYISDTPAEGSTPPPGAGWELLSSAPATLNQTSYLQDGSKGPDSTLRGKVDPISSGKRSVTITFTTDAAGHGSDSEVIDELDAAFEYYAVETAVSEGSQTFSGDPTLKSEYAELIGVYDPHYTLDRAARSVTVTNTRRDILTFTKTWDGDLTPNSCQFEVYAIPAGKSLESLEADFESLLAAAAAPVETFSLPETNTGEGYLPGSWTHPILKNVPYDPAQTYFVLETKFNGDTITESAAGVYNPDADYGQAQVLYSYKTTPHLLAAVNLSQPICKIVDKNGDEHQFRALKTAAEYPAAHQALFADSKVFTIEMLRDYEIVQNDWLPVAAGQKITLTTASTASDVEHPYQTTEAGVTRATISRGTRTGAFITVLGASANDTGTELIVKNLCLDGGSVTVNGNGGLIRAENATVELSCDAAEDAPGYAAAKAGAMSIGAVELKNGKALNGGAVWAKNCTVTIKKVSFAGCTAATTDKDKQDTGGGAIWVSGTRCDVSGSSFAACTTTNGNGGAILSMTSSASAETRALTVTGSSFTDCVTGEGGSTGMSGGAICHKNRAALSVKIENCEFLRCRANRSGDKNDKRGTGSVYADAKELHMYDCTVKESYSGQQGGGVFHNPLGSDDNNWKYFDTTWRTDVQRCIFTDCTAERSGGSLETSACNIEIKDSHFIRSKAKHNTKDGGAINIWYNTSKANSTSIASSSLLLEGCRFEDCQSQRNGGAVRSFVYSNTVTNCKFGNSENEAGCQAPNGSGGAIYTELTTGSSVLSISGSTFSNCSAKNSGGAVFTKNKTLNIDVPAPGEVQTESSFSNCTAANQNGGAMYVGGAAQLHSTKFESCNAKKDSKGNNGNGGAVYVTSSGSLQISGGSFTDCTADANGGGVCTAGETNVTNDFTFTSCTAKNGGGLYAGTTLTLQDGTFDSCKANVNDGNGGGVYLVGGRMTAEDCEFKSCQSASNGGGIYSSGASETLTHCTFMSCTAANGGGLYGKDSTGSYTQAAGCSFSYCTATGQGGAIYTQHEKLTAERTSDYPAQFLHCFASGSNGGAVSHDKKTDSADANQTVLTGCSFRDCSAAAGNGGALNTLAKKVTLLNNTFQDCSAKNGGGVHQKNTDVTLSISGDGSTEKTAWFKNCHATSNEGGALRASAASVTVSQVLFSGCYSESNQGGGVSIGGDSVAVNATFTGCQLWNCEAGTDKNGGAICDKATGGTLQIDGTEIDGSKRIDGSDGPARNAKYGGGVYSEGAPITLGTDTVIKNCKSDTNGGGVYAKAGVSLTGARVEDCETFKVGTSNDIGRGGGVYCTAGAVTLNEQAVISRCTAAKNGGGIYSFGDVTLAGGSSIENCTANDSGGGMYCNKPNNSTAAVSLTGASIIQTCKALTWNGGGIFCEAGVTLTLDASSVKFCSALSTDKDKGLGGGIFSNGSAVTLSSASSVTGCSANGTGGGGIYVKSAVVTVTGTDTESAMVSNCTAPNGSGGGIYLVTNTGSITLTQCQITGNRAKTQGGGVWSKGNITLGQNTSVTGNELTDGTTENGAGLYLDGKSNTGASLVLTGDRITVYGNTTAGTPSNVRLSMGTANDVNGDNSVLLQSTLTALSHIDVCNPGKKGSRFGARNDGCTGADTIRSEKKNVRGAEGAGNTLVWEGDPVCKITDDQGRLLLFKNSDLEKQEAKFNSLAEAIEIYNSGSVSFWYEDDTQAEAAQIQMLRGFYLDDGDALPVLTKNVLLTSDTDQAANPAGDRYTIYRGDVTGSIFIAAEDVKLTVRNLILDGTPNPGKSLAASVRGGIIQARSGAEVELYNVWLQNSPLCESGGAVYLDTDASLSTDGTSEIGTKLANCQAERGGAVFLNVGALHSVDGPTSILNCAANLGGAVFVEEDARMELNHSTKESTFTVSGCRADRLGAGEFNGAGIYLNATGALKLEGKLSFDDNLRNEVSSGTNGGSPYPDGGKPRQDIYLNYTKNDIAPNITLKNFYFTGESETDEWIWIWPSVKSHYGYKDQFAAIGDNIVSDEVLMSLRNAREDALTGADRAGGYLSGFRGEDNLVIWAIGDMDVHFLKVSSSGDKLAGARFSLYTDARCRVKNESGGILGDELYNSKSHNAVSAVSGSNGAVSLRVPSGIFYMKETETPAGFDNAMNREPVYILLAGIEGLTVPETRSGVWAAAGALSTVESQTALDELLKDGDKTLCYAIFPLDGNGKAVLTKNLAIGGIVNTPDVSRRVVLRKVSADGAAVQNAVFEILTAAGTPYTTADCTSDENGVFYLNIEMPAGDYTLREKSPQSRSFTLHVPVTGPVTVENAT